MADRRRHAVPSRRLRECCDAPSDARHAEFIELYNRGAETVDLSGWSFVDGVGYEFPSGTPVHVLGYSMPLSLDIMRGGGALTEPLSSTRG